MDELAAAVREALAAETRATFDERVERQAAAMRADIEAGALDNPDFAAGLELEAYVVDDAGRLAAAPESVFDLEGCDGELGVHNVEIHTPPDVLDADGLARQAETVRERVRRVRERLAERDLALVLDGMWTVPPPAGTRTYLGAVEHRDDVVVAEHMRENARYAALDNEIRRRADGSIPLDVPGYGGSFPSILLESLTTSIQPHLQVPDGTTFPAVFNTALRTTGPLLALTANSPFLPADLYDLDADGPDPMALVEATPHELRVPVFEQSINAGRPAGDGKVRFPRDVGATTDVVDRLVADPTYAPVVAGADTADGTYDQRYPELAHKRGTYWRWVRAVVGGQRPRGSQGTEASIRVEYRPLPTQPTATDVVACQALVCGLLVGLTGAEHPLETLPWDAARESFYAAVDDGLAADLAWVTADGERTDDQAVIFEEVFAYARRGLSASGVPDDRVEDLLAPMTARWEHRTTPSTWKKHRVRERLRDGHGFAAAITGMQRQYVERSREGDCFADWAG